ncbi:hypothetical protein AAES_04906 [Amazona aestiva]|uniref:Uncharacterized protein n=1 Tax=Amazona aestiva TaxID=12930 RepID=A0A0Q3U4D6_AMAAE|nr:hypothetical protein AAES_04906 [Amazona aestiva]
MSAVLNNARALAPALLSHQISSFYMRKSGVKKGQAWVPGSALPIQKPLATWHYNNDRKGKDRTSALAFELA